MVIFITVTLAVFMERLKARPKIITKINVNVMLDLTTCQELDTLIIEDVIHEFSMFLDKTKSFRHHRKCKDVRLCLTDKAKSFDYAAGLISQHCTSGLCGYHFYVNNFKITGLGADACKVRDLFFNLLRAPTECDKQFRMKALEAKLKEINKFDKDKWKNLVDNEDRLILCYRSKSSLSASLQVTTSAGEAINYHKIKRYLHSRSKLLIMQILKLLKTTPIQVKKNHAQVQKALPQSMKLNLQKQTKIVEKIVLNNQQQYQMIPDQKMKIQNLQ
ncbi:Hypothetical_protein [Hexamita inflata]|uniref:Hypothetical_protein n=1 Tax=Hexamita inflata TaxID=28002 RepID=A0AA86QLT8_9EUKA|nr:Hypothetical protein HINF_LOCUS3210 [Hexamita inflata]CAI9919913.1 Hypothetical protein HINF_LOCUS7558 [Hexamita inflata]CAI9957549.1 Hypothetical protein HINF_LOCUS45194 [Hexamita inflata]CAI9960915.1 Hypothetical protein HINF_LOCUS48560 [Hexamita inflata]